MSPASYAEDVSYPPDRTFALLYGAVTVGLLLIWLAPLALGAGDKDPYRLAGEGPGPIVAHVLSSLYGVWLCVAIYQGRRWAFIGLAFQCVGLTMEDVYSGGSLESAVSLLALGYGLLRLLALVGPKEQESAESVSFLPDRFAGATLAILDTATTISFLARPLPGYVVDAAAYIWFLGQLPQLLWYEWGVYRSKGWAIGIGFMFTTMGFFVQLPHPEQRLQRTEAALGILYFGLRLVCVGPRPKGFLGLGSQKFART